MAEPISASTAIGLALGGVNFLLKTVLSFYQLAHDLKDFEFAIRALRSSLRKCQLKLERDIEWN
ncbi:hypothetical protein QBC38DRAFT_459648 [Podospora fimiseda]|uniref:Fungal N-terminal domain-containing protein n=1 Tax=Podospora fimiseda TaxID=252190 RepID=A0AAN7BH32_9PEZI|nr:hypothetical protein QBC38DRAFT_459648 [Podospora fimiseda]